MFDLANIWYNVFLFNLINNSMVIYWSFLWYFDVLYEGEDVCIT